MKQRDYDSTVARIAGNILSGMEFQDIFELRPTSAFAAEAVPRPSMVKCVVALARAIVEETRRTEPKDVIDPDKPF